MIFGISGAKSMLERAAARILKCHIFQGPAIGTHKLAESHGSRATCAACANELRKKLGSLAGALWIKRARPALPGGLVTQSRICGDDVSRDMTDERGGISTASWLS
jgi:prenyltransferase beta subunit